MSSAMNDEFPMIIEVECDPKTGMQLQNCPPVTVGFGLWPRLNKKETEKAGYDVFTDREYVKVVIPTDRFSEFFQPATEEYRRRFPKAYADFKSRDKVPTTGMPIEQWPAVTRSMAYSLKAAHVYTVESLAGLDDVQVGRLGFNARELREKARAWIKTAADNAGSMKLAAEKQALEDRLSAMQAQMEALQQQSGAKPQKEVAVTPPQIAAEADVAADVAAAARRPRRGA